MHLKRLFAVPAVLLMTAAGGGGVALAAQNFSPGNLVLSRSEYQGSAGTVTVGQTLPGAVPTTFSAAGTNTTSGVVSSASGFTVGGEVQITTGGSTLIRTLTIISGKTLTWSVALPHAVAKNDTIVPLAVVDGTYPGVWANEAPDPSFGITSPIFLDELSPDGTLLNTRELDASKAVTSFPSKSELALNLAPDGSKLTFMGYVSPINTIDVSNSNTPGHVDPTDPVALTFQRVVGQLDSAGAFLATPVNVYSGNNGRAAILANGLYYMVGNAGNGSGTEPLNIINNTGVQATTPGGSADATVIGRQRGTCSPTVAANGCQFGFATGDVLVNGVALADDKSGKDDNFRGVTIFGNTLYTTKGSGSNGINTVYQVGTAGTLPTVATGAATAISVLSGFPTAIAKTATKANIFPFGMWFADANTLYVADEGDGTAADATSSPNAGLQKYVFSGGQWNLAYVLQSGLHLGQSYHVAGYDASLDPSPGGLRTLTGRRNDDGTATIWAVTSTTSANTDQGADPNQLVMINDVLANTDTPVAAGESFSLLRTAQFGEVLRGVSFTPGTINPVWTVSVTPPANANGWQKTDVNVELTAMLADGAISSIQYTLAGAENVAQTAGGDPANIPVTAEGTTNVSYFAENAAGSSSASRSLSVMIDKTPPTITFPGNAGSYTIDQVISITCVASDTLSLIDSSTCPGASGPAYTFPLGLNSLNASASDKAGNTTSLTGTFTVSVTYDSLANLTDQIVSQNGIVNSLVAKLSAAQKGKSAKAGSLGAYINEVSAQAGKALTVEQAAILIRLAGSL